MQRQLAVIQTGPTCKSFHLGTLKIQNPGEWVQPPASLVARMVKNLPATQETRVRFLGREDTLEKGMALYSSILAWRIPWTEGPGRLQSMGLQIVRHDRTTNTHTQGVRWRTLGS